MKELYKGWTFIKPDGKYGRRIEQCERDAEIAMGDNWFWIMPEEEIKNIDYENDPFCINEAKKAGYKVVKVKVILDE